MAHILDGTWNSFTIRCGKPSEDNKGSITLVIDERSGNLTEGSRQNGNTLRGKVVREGRFHAAQIINDGDNRTYEGIFSVEHSPGGGKQLFLAGRVRLNFVPPLDGREDKASNEVEQQDKKEKRLKFTQEQAIWVGSKP
jgi:hypothetical protein